MDINQFTMHAVLILAVKRTTTTTPSSKSGFYYTHAYYLDVRHTKTTRFENLACDYNVT